MENENRAKAAHHGLNEVLQDIEHTKNEDYACPRNRLNFAYDEETGYTINLGDRHKFPTIKHFNKQLTGSIAPGMMAYGRHLHSTGQHNLLVENVNRQLERDNRSAMIRTVSRSQESGERKSHARAILSDRYKVVDDREVFDVALPIIKESAQFYALGGRRSNTRTMMKFVSYDPLIQVGRRTMYVGFGLTNSEVGLSSTRYSAFLFDESCTNGTTFGNIGLYQARFVHRGASISTDFGRIFGDTFAEAERAAVRSAIAEATRKALDPQYHEQIAKIVERSHERKVTGDIPTVLEEVGRRVGLTEAEREQSLLHMDRQETHAYGIQAAITSMAQEANSYQRRTELEEAGGKILEFSDSIWSSVAALTA